MKEKITQAKLKELLSYDPETGDFTWLVGRKMAGKKAGSPHNQGYFTIRISRKLYLSHRLAWLYVYGAFPKIDLDHINGVKSDTRIDNLRECSESQNQWNSRKPKNNISGFKGVCWNKRAGKWHAQIMINLNKKHLGYFLTAESAYEAYQDYAATAHGEFYHNTTKQENL